MVDLAWLYANGYGVSQDYEAAIRSLLQALQVFSLDNAPLNWAMAKHISKFGKVASWRRWSEWEDLNLRPPRPERGGRGITGGAVP
jgi:hypothetical protein